MRLQIIIIFFPFLQLFGQNPISKDSLNIMSTFKITDKGVLSLSNIQTDTLILQQFRFDKWVSIDTITNLKGKTYSKYIKPYIHSGENIFRFRPLQLGCFIPIKYSYLSDKNCKIISNIKQTETIVFSDSTYFELYDEKGNLISKGLDSEIHIRTNTKRDTFVLLYDDKKKKIK